MDEEQINELLECSVCLEQFDQSCKVLPCQHTYCRRCLDEIVLTKFELRCPECRMLITTPVAELPTNILVMRILERLNNQRATTTKGSTATTTSLSTALVKLPSNGGGGSSVGSSPSRCLGVSPHRHSARDGQQGTQVAGYLLRQNQPFAKALYSYESTEREDLSFKKGDIIILKRQVDENWYLGEYGGKTGFFPANFVRVMVPLPQIPQSKALYDFDLKDENEKDCLSFKKDEVITVIRRVDENWLEGRQGDKIGIFPISFVELNDAARMLVNSKSNNGVTTSSSTTISSSSSSTSSSVPVPPPLTMPSSSSLSTSSPPPSSSSISPSTIASTVSLTSVLTAVNRSNSPLATSMLITNSSSPSSSSSLSSSSSPPPFHSTISTSSAMPSVSLVASTQQNPSSLQSKRHSYAPSSCSSPLPLVDSSQQRHSLDVTLCPPESLAQTVSMATSSSLPPAPHQVTEQPSQSSVSSVTSADSERNTTTSPSISPTPVVPDSTSSVHASVSSGGATSQSGSPAPPIYVALYNYHPQKDDELVLHKGDHYSVVEKCQDGWFKGSCVKTGKAGVFPGNYVTILRHGSAFKPMNPNVLNIRAKCPSGGSLLSQQPPAPASSTTTISTTIPAPVQPGHSSSINGVVDPNHTTTSSVCRRPADVDPPVDSSVTSGPPPLMPRVAKMAVPGSSKSRQVGSHLMSVPLRSFSQPGTATASPLSMSSSMSSSAPIPSASLLSDASKSKSSSHLGPALFTSSSPHRNKTWVSSHHHLQQHQQQQPLSSLSATSVTHPPPNVVMTSSHDSFSSLLQSLNKDKDKKKKKGGFLNLLKEKTSKLTSSSSDNEPQSLPVVGLDGVSHTRSGSFPADSNARSSGHHPIGSGPAVEHRKAQSLDSTSVALPPPPPVPDKPSRQARPSKNKYCCVVPYPPQMFYELDLEVGDIVYVIRKREDGWYKGTHERTGKTGMFPASFVEKCD